MKIPFHKVSSTNEEIQAVTKVIKSGWWTTGPNCITFENNFKELTQSKFALSVSSCTSALHLALKSVGVKEGDEVIIPTNTFVATMEVVSYLGAKPILCDINETDHNIDVTKIESLITCKTKVVIPVHFAGFPCDMDKISDIAKKYNLYVIEDAAHALPTYYKKKLVGNLSDITCFSFYATKTLSTAEGGMITTDNPKLYDSMKINRIHGINGDAWERYSDKGKWYYEIVDQGYKYNLSDISASIGIVQLKKLFNLNEMRTQIANRYMKSFCESGIDFVNQYKKNKSSWHLFVIKVKNRDFLYQKLSQNGIGTSVHFIPLYKHKFYAEKYKFNSLDYPVTEKIFDRILSIPIFPDLSIAEQDYIISHILKYAEK